MPLKPCGKKTSDGSTALPSVLESTSPLSWTVNSRDSPSNHGSKLCVSPQNGFNVSP
eukprot:CAMPEP_0172847358 /NCGR_PEP_ID=MMETSP1075-20121228/39909_1 /TAXON_ID=2916 /ORGANISM="Ceratium fusus, Strain PA161109" /LENGTH=56 /DNA_ID=CAMNT_0013692355 /DNA_START=13 /DNA_END=179 /DNA_ORIENTATION=+